MRDWLEGLVDRAQQSVRGTIREVKAQGAETQTCPHCGREIIVAIGAAAAVMTRDQAFALKDEDEA